MSFEALETSFETFETNLRRVMVGFEVGQAGRGLAHRQDLGVGLA
jgi:hypothetical protein